MALTKEQRDYKYFEVVKSIAYKTISDRKMYYHLNEAEQTRQQYEFKNRGMDDAAALYRCLMKEIKAHNSELEGTNTRLNNLRFKHGWEKSTLLHGIKIKDSRIFQLIDKYPDKDAYDIRRYYTGEKEEPIVPSVPNVTQNAQP